MPARHARHIALTDKLAHQVASQVSKGEYASVSDMVRPASHLLQDRDEARATRRVDATSSTQPIDHRA